MQELRTKLSEESEEYMSVGSDQEALEELANMLEVIRALAEVHGANAAQLDKLRADKTEARGGLQERVYLIDVDEACVLLFTLKRICLNMNMEKAC